jgi:hypothetical protein
MAEASHSASGAMDCMLIVQLLPLLDLGVDTISNWTFRHNGCRSSALPTRRLISSMVAATFSDVAA